MTIEELLEEVFQLALYAGHARFGNALRVVREVCDEQGLDPQPVGGSVADGVIR